MLFEVINRYDKEERVEKVYAKVVEKAENFLSKQNERVSFVPSIINKRVVLKIVHPLIEKSKSRGGEENWVDYVEIYKKALGDSLVECIMALSIEDNIFLSPVQAETFKLLLKYDDNFDPMSNKGREVMSYLDEDKRTAVNIVVNKKVEGVTGMNYPNSFIVFLATLNEMNRYCTSSYKGLTQSIRYFDNQNMFIESQETKMDDLNIILDPEDISDLSAPRQNYSKKPPIHFFMEEENTIFIKYIDISKKVAFHKLNDILMYNSWNNKISELFLGMNVGRHRMSAGNIMSIIFSIQESNNLKEIDKIDFKKYNMVKFIDKHTEIKELTIPMYRTMRNYAEDFFSYIYDKTNSNDNSKRLLSFGRTYCGDVFKDSEELRKGILMVALAAIYKNKKSKNQKEKIIIDDETLNEVNILGKEFLGVCIPRESLIEHKSYLDIAREVVNSYNGTGFKDYYNHDIEDKISSIEESKSISIILETAVEYSKKVKDGGNNQILEKEDRLKRLGLLFNKQHQR